MAESITIGNINDAYRFVGTCDPYKIRKATLHSPLVGEYSVWLIALRGTNSALDTKDPLGLPAAALSGGGIKNIYSELVKNAILSEIPAGEMLVFIGHSLGGMVCQQLGADKQLKSRYRILNILTFGSPYILFRGSKCPSLHRMAERADILPVLCSLAFFANPFIGNVRHESGGYFFNFLGAHCDSYENSEVWRKYDCFGIEHGERTITFEEE